MNELIAQVEDLILDHVADAWTWRREPDVSAFHEGSKEALEVILPKLKDLLP